MGINLTAADTCIIYDSDWNPQVGDSRGVSLSLTQVSGIRYVVLCLVIFFAFSDFFFLVFSCFFFY